MPSPALPWPSMVKRETMKGWKDLLVSPRHSTVQCHLRTQPRFPTTAAPAGCPGANTILFAWDCRCILWAFSQLPHLPGTPQETFGSEHEEMGLGTTAAEI